MSAERVPCSFGDEYEKVGWSWMGERAGVMCWLRGSRLG